jgi:biotin synthase-related radical SAM superfamily protein
MGLGETDEELEACIGKLVSHGIIPVLRPLNPVAEFTGKPRPSAERLEKFFALQAGALTKAGLDPKQALTMCTNCAGCDLVPGRDE